MASQLKVDALTGVTTAGSISVTGEGNSTTTNLQQGLAKALSRSDNSATLSDSFNIASTVDVATGQWRFNKTNVMSSVNYEAVSSSGDAINSFATAPCVFNAIESTTAHTMSKYGSGFEDFQTNGRGNCVVFGSLA